MITIRCAQFDFEMENQSFAHTLYGRWEDFCRVSFEKVVDEVLSRYDCPDTEIRLDTLTLDLGVLSEEDFYAQFPRRLARCLDEIFSAYLADRETYAGQMQIIPVRTSRLHRFAFYLLHGYLSWEEESPAGTLTDWLNRLIDEEPDELLAFLYRHGGELTLRTRLVLQFSDPQLDSLVALVVPSDSRFIQKFVRFLIESHKRMQRPEARSGDYRQVVWGVVWAYLLSESKGYYSRKQFVQHTLRQLAARYNLTYLQLLDWLTAGVREWAAVRLVIPELVVLLSEMRQEEWMRFTHEKIQAEELSIRQLRELLSLPDSCRRMLRHQPEPVIYGWVEKILPLESSFVIGYARTLDEEKEKGLMEGKAGDDFRLIKWEFIFQVMLGAMRDSFNRAAFVYAVLKQLAAHYNLETGQLLSYFYAGLVSGKVQAETRLRELMIALFLEATDTWETFSAPRFPSPLAETLGNVYLCRKFLAPLPEEKIYKLVDRVAPAESPFIVQYARTLDKGKEENALAGKAGTEFRLLKWEFIFLLLLRAPLSYFSRKQFVRSVLQQIAAHYNLKVAELIRFFYENLQTSAAGLSSQVGGVLLHLFEEMEKESPELLLTREARREWQAGCLKAFLAGRSPAARGGDPVAAAAGSLEELEEFMQDAARREPDVLLEAVGSLRAAPLSVLAAPLPEGPGSVRILAFLLRLVIRRYGLNFPRQPLLVKALEAAPAGGCPISAGELRRLLYFCVNSHAEEFQQLLAACLESGPGWGGVFAEREEKRTGRDEAAKTTQGERKGWEEKPTGEEGARAEEEELSAKDLRPEEKAGELAAWGKNNRPGLAAEAGASSSVGESPSGQPLAAAGVSGENRHPASSSPEKPGAQRRDEKRRDEKRPEERNRDKETGNEENRDKGKPYEGKAMEKGIGETDTAHRSEGEGVIPSGLGDKETLSPASTGDRPALSGLPSYLSPELFYRWLQRQAAPAVRMVVEEFLWLRKYLEKEVDTSAWLRLLVSLTEKTYAYYGVEGLYRIVWEKLQHLGSPAEKEKIRRMVATYPQQWPGLAGAALADGPAAAADASGEEAAPAQVYIRNAGLVLLSPYFPRLFSLLHLLDAGRRLSEPEKQVKAIFAMQYLATADQELPEYELFLNKLLSGYPQDESFSPFSPLEEAEKQILLSLLNSVKQNWNQMKNTSIEGFRKSFLLREGVLEEKEDRWLLTVEPRAYDLLLDTLPWSYSPVKFSWMNKPVYVRWR